MSGPPLPDPAFGSAGPWRESSSPGGRDLPLSPGAALGDPPALFGACLEPGLVAAEALKPGAVTLWFRREGRTESREEPFRPFLWLSGRELLGGFPGEVEVVELAGPGRFRILARVATMKELAALSQHVARVSGVSAGHPDSPQVFHRDPVHLYLLETGRTFFRGMAFEALRRLQVQVIPDLQPGSLHPDPERDPLLVIALSDGSGWEEALAVGQRSEREVIEAFVSRVIERDPDVLEGHDLFKAVLPFLARRAAALGVRLKLGRDGSLARSRASRLQIAERSLDYPRWEVHGRTLLDTWVLAQLHDVSGRELDSTALEDVAGHLGVARASGERLEVWEAPARFRTEPAAVLQAALEDVREVRAISDRLTYPYFLQGQIFPYTFQDVTLRGNATRINALFLREYLRQGVALPDRPVVKPFAGGLTAQEHEGLARGVLHVDVQSLYPSILLAWRLQPAGDSLGVFLGLLEVLREFRLEARRREREAQDEPTRRWFGGLQATFKILINSFYGYLGFPQGQFADFDRAAEVTARGRELLATMIGWIKDRGGRILEADTDGIYFVPPSAVQGRAEEEALVRELNRALPEGIQVDLDGRFVAMYCHKKKNYALLDEQGTVTLRGSGLRSRSMEPFLREALEGLLTLALQGRAEEIPALLEGWSKALEQRRVPVKRLARTEILGESPEAYLKKVEGGGRNRAAAYELALAADRGLRAGDPVSYYITGEKANVTAYDHCRLVTDHEPSAPDENPAYYRKKLKELEKKFAPLLQTGSPP